MADLAGVDQADDLRAELGSRRAAIAAATLAHQAEELELGDQATCSAEAQDLELGDQRAARRPGPSSSSSSATCSAERRRGDVAGVLLVELDLGDLQAQPRQPLESATAELADQRPRTSSSATCSSERRYGDPRRRARARARRPRHVTRQVLCASVRLYIRAAGTRRPRDPPRPTSPASTKPTTCAPSSAAGAPRIAAAAIAHQAEEFKLGDQATCSAEAQDLELGD